MKFIILDHYYYSYLRALYKSQPGLLRGTYQEQRQNIMEQCFGTADFYSSNLKLLGQQAEEIIINCEPLQEQWAKENGVKVNLHKAQIKIGRRKGIPLPSLKFDKSWLRQVLLSQIKSSRPDVLYVQDPWSFYDMDLLEEVRPYVKLLVCQHASPLPSIEYFKGFNLVLSSLPNQVTHFKAFGLKSEYLAIGFESSLINRILLKPSLYQVVHVGGYSGVHKERTELLYQVSKSVDIDFWGYGVEKLPPDSKIRQRYRGPAWGRDMYYIRGSSKITLTKHISSVSGNFANNMTLYEATGIGSLLVTDLKSNLNTLFEVGKEIIAYETVDDCIQKIRYYLEHEDERAAIAAAGQQRTLKEHTYFHRMQQLLDILKKYI